MPSRPAGTSPKSPPEDLQRFLKRVLLEQEAVIESFAADPIHDLRVALRRCRSLAEGFATLDDDGDWKELRSAAKKLQSGLARLRDAQVMAAAVRRLKIAGGPAGAAVAEALRRDERKGQEEARAALEDFSRKRWKRLRRRLPQRAERLASVPVSFMHLALERVREASALQHRWRGGQSVAAAHSLRIAVKHFRYTVQSFLPEQYAAWEKDLKRMQDALGEIHDLDVLRAWLLKVARRESLDPRTVHAWMRRISVARQERVESYKKAVSVPAREGERGKQVLLWDRWREEIERLVALSSPNYGGVSG